MKNLLYVIFVLLFIILAGCGDRELLTENSILQDVVKIYYSHPAFAADLPIQNDGSAPPYHQRLMEWQRKYEWLHEEYRRLQVASRETRQSHFAEETLTHLLRLTQWAASDIKEALSSPPPVNSPEYRNLVSRFEALNYAIADRITLVQIKLGHSTYLDEEE